MNRLAQSALAGAWALALALALAGCVKRDFSVTSDPPGALVTINSERVGRTPLTTPFTWYGDYEILLEQDGYETLQTHHRVRAPWYDVFPVDLLSTLAPWTYRVQRSAHFTMDKASPPTEEELLRRAEELRQRNAQPVPGER